MDNVLRLASPLQFDSFVDGPGIRMVVWTQGCHHHCKSCHNPQTWNENGGEAYQISDLIQQIQDAQLQTGITFSGGEPFLQASKLIPLALAAKKKKLNLWAYTGYSYEELLQDEEKKAFLEYLDVLVDGKFEVELKDYRLVFKGSKNQRIIDVQASLQKGEVVLSSYDDKNQEL